MFPVFASKTENCLSLDCEVGSDGSLREISRTVLIESEDEAQQQVATPHEKVVPVFEYFKFGNRLKIRPNFVRNHRNSKVYNSRNRFSANGFVNFNSASSRIVAKMEDTARLLRSFQNGRRRNTIR